MQRWTHIATGLSLSRVWGMSETKRKLRNSRQTDLTELSEGPDTKRKRSPAGKSAASKQRDSQAASEGLVQTTVEDAAATSASASGAKLVDPNTGKEVKLPAGDNETPASSKPTKGKASNTGQLLDPNTGEKVEACSVVKSEPAAKPSSSKQVKKEQSNDDTADASSSDKDQPVQINRAPVLTLWVAVVAERQGFSKEAGLTFGKAISGMLAQSKGRSIGVLDKKETDEGSKQDREEEEHKQGIAKHDVFGMNIKAKDVGDDGDVRAMDTSMQVGFAMAPELCVDNRKFAPYLQAIQHKQVEGYLQRAFKDRLQDAKAALETLANSYKPEDIGKDCYHLYEQFRPNIASGQKGWGQKGQLDLVQIRQLAEQH